MTFENKFAAFSRRDLVYSIINGHDIMDTVMIPSKLQDLPAGKYPVLIHWHGGGFLTRHQVYAPWWPEWSVSTPLRWSNISLPNSRVPGSSSSHSNTTPYSEALTTATSLKQPVPRSFPISPPSAPGSPPRCLSLLPLLAASPCCLSLLPLLAAREAWHATPDLSRLAAIGASSGGYMALQMALLFREKLDVGAVMTVCSPPNDISSGTLVPRGPRRILGSMPPPPREAELLIREYIRKVRPGDVRTEGDPANMWPMLLSVAQQAWLGRLLGIQKNPQLDLNHTLDQVSSIPPLWISHANEDSIIPVGCSTDFAKVENKFPGSPLLLTVKPGYHTWTDALSMSEPWVREGCDFINQFWV